MIKINLAKDFSEFPFGRYRTDGKYSAQKFREDLLAPSLSEAIANGDKVFIDLTNIPLGLGSSFLEESFGGLVRRSGFDAERVISSIKLETDDYLHEHEIIDYIKEAKPSD